MGRKRTSESTRARHVVAQEAARIIVHQGIRDYRVAKQKAAERLGLSDSLWQNPQCLLTGHTNPSQLAGEPPLIKEISVFVQ